MNKIKPSLAKGTRDFGPDEMEKREYVMNIFKDVFNLYGFRSIQTPSIENTEVLTGNYGEEGDKLIFRILNSGDFLKNTSEKDLNDQNNLKSKICLTRAVWGNIDNEIIRRETEEYLIFKIKNFKILIIHIAGKINSYNRKTRDLILENKPNLLVCGHSHILKIARDKKYNLIYMNPGAVGKVGFHKEKTMVRFNLVDDKIEDMQVIKLDG